MGWFSLANSETPLPDHEARLEIRFHISCHIFIQQIYLVSLEPYHCETLGTRWAKYPSSLIPLTGVLQQGFSASWKCALRSCENLRLRITKPGFSHPVKHLSGHAARKPLFPKPLLREPQIQYSEYHKVLLPNYNYHGFTITVAINIIATTLGPQI